MLNWGLMRRWGWIAGILLVGGCQEVAPYTGSADGAVAADAELVDQTSPAKDQAPPPPPDQAPPPPPDQAPPPPPPDQAPPPAPDQAPPKPDQTPPQPDISAPKLDGITSVPCSSWSGWKVNTSGGGCSASCGQRSINCTISGSKASCSCSIGKAPAQPCFKDLPWMSSQLLLCKKAWQTYKCCKP